MQLLAADRDRLLARLDALERNIEVTGSIPQDNAGAAAASRTLSGTDDGAAAGLDHDAQHDSAGRRVPAANASGARHPGCGGDRFSHPDLQRSRPQPAERTPLNANEQAAESTVTRTEFGVDVGGNHTLDGVARASGPRSRANHGALLEGLRPLVAVREGSKPGAVELRLVAGPLANAVAAARLCASLSAAGVACQPTVFDGQRLALR